MCFLRIFVSLDTARGAFVGVIEQAGTDLNFFIFAAGEFWMNDQQCPCFKGDLALLRVCAVIFIASVFNIIVGMLLSAVHEGLLVSLWSAFTTSSFEDLLSMFLPFIVSGVAIPIGLGVLAVLGVLVLAIYALVKKKVTILKVFSVLFYIWFVAGSFALDPMKDLLGSQNFASIIVNSIFNVYVVVAVATFFIESKKHADENVNEVVAEKFNVGLFRFCAACFFVCGLNGITQLICGQTSFLSFALFGILALIASVLVLVKKSAAFLMLGVCDFQPTQKMNQKTIVFEAD